ncbi:MAG: hypothetical protein Q4B95_08360, partial [Lonepinella koalarum]|nr:hypothetical protein [Lonepinella koalarum]
MAYVTTFSPVNIYYDRGTGPVAGSINKVINQTNAMVDITASSTSGKQLSGIAVSNRVGKSIIHNDGGIRIINENAVGSEDTVAMSTLGQSLEQINNGKISVQGNREVVGMGTNLTYTTGNVLLHNTGTIEVQGGINTIGMEIYNPSQAQVGEISIVNTGLVKVTGVGSGIDIQSAKDIALPIQVRNTGLIELAQDGTAVINVVNRDISTALHITNSGSLIDRKAIDPLAIQTGIADDIFEQTAGETVGDIELNGGNDRFIVTGGKLVGKTHLG